MSEFQVSFETDFAVIGPERRQRFFPFLSNIPKPGQWVYIERQRLGVTRFLAQVTEVNITQINKDLYEVTVAINRKSVKEDVLFAKLARRVFDLIDLEKELLEPIDLLDSIQISDQLTLTTIPLVPSYSNANVSDAEVSNQ